MKEEIIKFSDFSIMEDKKNSTLKTEDSYHNLGFYEEHKFFSDKWKDKKLCRRQIFFDTSPYPDIYFELDIDTGILYIYFESLGTKENPRIIEIGKLPEDYIDAVTYVYNIEIKVLKYFLKNNTLDDISNITTWDKLNKIMP